MIIYWLNQKWTHVKEIKSRGWWKADETIENPWKRLTERERRAQEGAEGDEERGSVQTRLGGGPSLGVLWRNTHKHTPTALRWLFIAVDDAFVFVQQSDANDCGLLMLTATWEKRQPTSLLNFMEWYLFSCSQGLACTKLAVPSTVAAQAPGSLLIQSLNKAPPLSALAMQCDRGSWNIAVVF